ncbi:hypothetical protein Pta02_12200 [Planobispora takensis]|uniref:Tc1-like transposase DDE domain-containing protein n=1 Tax=Planobispora takensis TaxID=1367882 RepID=A0A8J3WTT1_9ACTN|nr:hypothetical protein Pta02_12200 [Planobispora takensis]
MWCWDNLNVHLARELAAFAEENSAWLRVVQLPTYAPERNPAEGIWSLLKHAIANFIAADLSGIPEVSPVTGREPGTGPGRRSSQQLIR